MKNYQLIAASLIIGTQLSAKNFYHDQSEDFFASTGLKKAMNSGNEVHDVIILQDGTQIVGIISDLPTQKFKFGELSFEVDHVAAIEILPENGKTKMRLITREGHIFISDVPEERFGITQYFPSFKNPTHKVSQEIAPKTVSHISFKERGEHPSVTASDYYTLRFKNGDEMPLVLTEGDIRLNDGSRDVSLKNENIIKISVLQDGVDVLYKDDKGSESKTQFAFIKDKYLRVVPIKSQQTIGIPWNSIHSLTLVQDVNSLKKNSSNVSVDSASSEEINKLRSAAKLLDKENTGLVSKVNSLNESREELLMLQNDLVSNLELEFARTTALRKSLQELVVKWEGLRSYARKLENKLNDLHAENQNKKEGTYEIELAFRELQEIKRALETQRNTAANFDDQIANMSRRMNEENASKHERQASLAEYQEKANRYKNEISKLTEEFESYKSMTLNTHQGLYDDLAELETILAEEKKHSKQIQENLQVELTQVNEALTNEKNNSKLIQEGLLAQLENVKTSLNEKNLLSNTQQTLSEELMTLKKALVAEKDNSIKSQEALYEELANLKKSLAKEKNNSLEVQQALYKELSSLKENLSREELKVLDLSGRPSIESYKMEFQELQNTLSQKNAELEKLQQLHQELSASLSNEINQLVAQKNDYESYHDQLEEVIDNLLGTIELEKKRSSQLESDLKQMTQNASSLEQEYQVFQSNMNSKLEQMEVLKNTQQELQLTLLDQLNDLIDKNQEALIEKNQLETQINELDTQLTREKIQSHSLSAELNKTLQAYENSQQKMQMLEKAAAKLEQDLELTAKGHKNKDLELQALRTDVLERHKAFKDFETKSLDVLNEEKNRSRQLEIALEEITNQFDSHKQQYNTFQSEVSSKLEQMQILKTTHQELHHSLLDQINDLIDQNQDAMLEKNQLETEINELDKALAKEQIQTKSLNIELRNAIQAYENTQKRVQALEVMASNLKQDLEFAERVENNKNLELQALKNEIQEKNRAFKDYEAATKNRLENLAQNTQELSNALAEKDAHSYQLQRELQIAAQKNKDLQSELASELSKALTALSKKDQEIKMLSTAHKSLKADYVAKNELSNQHALARSQIEGELEALKLHLQAVASDYESEKMTRSEIEMQLNALNFQLDQTELAVKNLHKMNEQSKQTLVAVLDENDKLKQERNQLEKKVAELQKSENDAKKNLQGLEREVKQTSIILQELQNELVKSKKIIDSKQEQIDHLEVSHDELHSDLFSENAMLKKQMGDELEKFEMLKSHLASLLPKYESEKAKREGLENQLKMLHSQLSDAKNKLGNKETNNAFAKENYKPYNSVNDKPTTFQPSAYGYRGVHVVAEGDNLTTISMQYYGVPYRWSDIYEANHDVIHDVNKLKLGTALVIPE